jgi:competence protein ComEC
MNPTKKKKNIFNIFIILLLVITLIYLASFLLTPKKEGILLHFFDVGQGDATLIEVPQGQKVLIDGGPNDSVISKIDKIIPFYKRKIDVVILTHPHADHVTGLIKVLENYEIGDVYLTGVIHTTPEYLQFLEKLKEKNIPSHQVVAGDTLDFSGGIKMDFLYPKNSLGGKKVENLNNSSIVARLSWGKESALFTGDLEKENQYQLFSSSIKSDLLKVPHHCSNNAINKGFLERVDPKNTVIFVGRDNKFGHPTAQCLETLKSTKAYRTDYDGDIDFVMNQTEIKPL